MSTASPRTPGRSQPDADPLADGFDPASLVVPQLRSLLLQHNVVLPSSARKQHLVDAFEKHVRPQVHKLREQRSAVKPSKRGIKGLHATSSVSTTPSAMRKGPRSSTPDRRRVSFSAPEDSSEDDEEEDKSVDPDTSAFSDVNPFQRASSAGSESENDVKPSKLKQKPAGRKSLPAPSTKPASSTQPRRRKSSTGALSSTASAKPAATASKPIRPFMHKHESGDSSQAVFEDSDAESSSKRVSSSRKARRRLRGDELTLTQKLTQVGWSALLLVALLSWAWYVNESRTVGFCDSGKASNDLLRRRSELRVITAARHDIDGSADDEHQESYHPLIPDALRPSCAPCPAHARCAEGQLRGCVSKDYVVRDSLLGRLPLVSHVLTLSAASPSCVPDDRKLLLAVELASELERQLAAHKGQVMCGRTHGDEEVLKALGVKSKRLLPAERAIAEGLPEKRTRKEWAQAVGESSTGSGGVAEEDPDFFEDLWRLATEHLEGSGAIERLSIPSLDGGKVLTSRRAELNISCRLKLALWTLWRSARIWVAVLAVLVGAAASVRRKFARARSEKSRVGVLVGDALERLQEQEHLHSLDPILNPDPFLATAQLRDHVLRSETSANERRRLWNGVARIVEANANVRTREAKVRGEWTRVWEWVGLGGGRRKAVSIKKEEDASGAGAGRNGEAVKEEHRIEDAVTQDSAAAYEMSQKADGGTKQRLEHAYV